MSTPYRIEYLTTTKKTRKICVSDSHDGYPKDIITEIIPADLVRIKENEAQFITDIREESEDYYGRRLDPNGNCPFEYLYIVDVEKNTVTVTYPSMGIDTKVVIELSKFTPEVMGIENYNEMMEEVQYGFECIDEATLEMIESYGFVVTGVTVFTEEV